MDNEPWSSSTIVFSYHYLLEIYAFDLKEENLNVQIIFIKGIEISGMIFLDLKEARVIEQELKNISTEK